MKAIDRRRFLAVSGVAAGSALVPLTVSAGEGAAVPTYDDAIAVLYDATRCIGCRSCMRACREAHKLPPEEGEIDGEAYDMPSRLSANTWTVIQAYRGEDEPDDDDSVWSFFKRSCMHCNVPACVSACPVAALRKTDEGAVVYDESRCIGCRYCLLACPYHVPRYEWVDRVPRVRKCDWKRACVKVCPAGALTEGPRREMIAEAKRRIEREPDRYVDHVYGEHEAGGASYLVLAGVEHRKLALPVLGPEVRSSISDPIMKGLPGWIVGMGLFLGGLYQVGRWQERHGSEDAS